MSDTTGCPTADTIDAACVWLIMLGDDNVSAADKEAFADWLLRSSTHIREFLWCDQLWSWLQEIDWNYVAAATEVARAGGTSTTPAPPTCSDLH